MANSSWKILQKPIAFDELFTQLRLHSIAHLGRVEQAVLENNGEVSVYYVDEKDLRYGLPILPDTPEYNSYSLPGDGMYTCVFCGKAQELKQGTTTGCALW